MKHPNAVVGGTAASGCGVLIVWLADLVGYTIPPLVVPVLAGMCAALALAIGRDGIKGIAHRIWSGRDNVQ